MGRSGFSWRSRYTHRCVSLVEGVAAAEVVRRFGADAEQITLRDPRQVAVMYDEANGYRPVVKAVGRYGWSVAFEQSSIEGVRPEVLRRLAAGTRALSFADTGTGMSLLGYAEDGAVVDAFEPSGTYLVDDRMARLAQRIGIELNPRADGSVCPVLDLASALCGFAITDDVVEASGPAAVVLPVLPDPPSTPLAVVTGSDARLAALLRCVTPVRLSAAVLTQARNVAVNAGLGGYQELMAALTENAAARGGQVLDESPLGILLRMLIADRRSTPAAAFAEVARTTRSRADVAIALHAVLVAEPRLAVAEMARRRLGTTWREGLLAELGDVEVPDEVLREEQDKVVRLRRRSVPTGASDPRVGRDTGSGSREQRGG